MGKYRLKIVTDSANGLSYWAYHTPELVIESKKSYKNPHTCELKAIRWARKQNLNWYEIFLSETEYETF